MLLLDSKLDAFWESFSFLSDCSLEVKLPTCSTTSKVDTSSAYVSEGRLIVPGAGLSFDTACFKEIYASASPAKLSMISEHRRLALSFTLEDESMRQKFGYFAKAFALDTVPDDFQLESPVAPHLCPCCMDAAKYRVKNLAQNPLTCILDHAAGLHYPLVVSLRNADGQMMTSHTPVHLKRQGGRLISEGRDNQFQIDITHLHAMRLNEVRLDGVPHISLALYNSRGEKNCSISAVSFDMANTWQTILDNKNHCYEMIEP